MGYQISNILDIGQSCVLKSDVQYCFPYISAALCCTKMGLNLKLEDVTFKMGYVPAF